MRPPTSAATRPTGDGLWATPHSPSDSHGRHGGPAANLQRISKCLASPRCVEGPHRSALTASQGIKCHAHRNAYNTCTCGVQRIQLANSPHTVTNESASHVLAIHDDHQIPHAPRALLGVLFCLAQVRCSEARLGLLQRTLFAMRRELPADAPLRRSVNVDRVDILPCVGSFAGILELAHFGAPKLMRAAQVQDASGFRQ